MGWYTTDYRKDHSSTLRKPLLDRGFWLDDVPRLMLWCRLFDHKPVIDGVDYGTHGQRSRWVVCDRCGTRPNPQGRLDPAKWTIGQAYDGPLDYALPATEPERRQAIQDRQGTFWPPGPWPLAPTSTLGGQLIIGRTYGAVGIELKIGNGGSEQTIAGSLSLHRLGALHLFTKGHGQWLQRRLNPTGHDSRVIEVSIDYGDLNWRFWAKRNGGNDDLPRWRYGRVGIDPRDILLGPVRRDHTDVGDPVTVRVRMPHGDDYTASVKLQKVRTGRRRGRSRYSWAASWRCAEGIPTKPNGRGGVVGAYVDISESAAERGSWPTEAAAAIASRMTRDRVRHGYEATPSGRRAQ